MFGLNPQKYHYFCKKLIMEIKLALIIFNLEDIFLNLFLNVDQDDKQLGEGFSSRLELNF